MTLTEMAAVLAVVAASSGLAGYHYGSERYHELHDAEKAAREKAEAAGKEGKAQLDAALLSLELTDQRVKDVLNAKSSKDRLCMSAELRGLLNGLAAGELRPQGDPGAGQGSRPAAADPGGSAGASEASVTQWSRQVIKQYEGCRAELAAVRTAAGEALQKQPGQE